MAARTIVIIGGGFAGVTAAQRLKRRLPEGWEVVLFSQENHFIFTPLLGDVVGSSINPMHVVWPIRQMARGATCRTAAARRIDRTARVVEYALPDGGIGRQPYDHLVLASGSTVNLDIIPGMSAHGWPFKTMGDALLLRNRLIGLMEQAEVEVNAAERRRLLSVVVVGGGFSGVEVAGEVVDLMKESCRFYRNIQESDIRVSLLEFRERILPELPEKLSLFAQDKMRGRGVDIWLNAKAQSVTGAGIRLDEGHGVNEIDSATVICTIGTMTNPLIRSLELPMAGNRVKTGGDFQVEGTADTWALGDCAATPNAYDQKLCAPTAQMAIRQGAVLADNIVAALAGRPRRMFSYKPVGMLAAIGNHKGVGLVFGLRISGFLAWFVWRGIYLGKMPTLARKIQIAFDWAWQLIFPRDIVQLSLGSTERFGRAHFEPGQFVFHKGDAGDKFYVIERGRAGVYTEENEPAVTELGAGDHFGEGALLKETPRSASIKAETTLDVLVMHRASFGQLTQNLELLRRALEQSDQTNRSADALWRRIRDLPALQTTPVSAAMSQPVACLPETATFADALRQAQDQKKGAYPVVDSAGTMVGLCTRTDFYRALQKPAPPETLLRELMTKPVLTVKASDTLASAMMTFVREPIKRLAVVADDEPGRVVGMVTPFDIARRLEG